MKETSTSTKRAILWSVQQQTITVMQKSTSKITQSSVAKQSQQKTKRESTMEPKTFRSKFTSSGSSFKLQLPTFKQGNAEKFLHFLYKFSEAKSKLGYNSCQQLESGLEQLLQGHWRNNWPTTKSTVSPDTQTIAAFNDWIFAYKCICIPNHLAIKYKKVIYKEFAKMINLQFHNSWTISSTSTYLFLNFCL